MSTTTMHPKATKRRFPGAAVAVAVMLASVLMACSWQGSDAKLVREPVSQPLEGATSADVEIAVAIGQLRIGALAQTDTLIAGEISYPERHRVTRDAALSGNTASFTLREQDDQNNNGYRFNDQKPLWDLRLSPTTPLRLTLESGVGEGMIDLAQLQVTDLTLAAGVGNSTLTLPRQGGMHARIEGGIGNTTIIIPAGVAVRVESSAGLGNVNLPAGYTQQGNVAVSSDFDTAANRIELAVQRGIGNITIKQSNN